MSLSEDQIRKLTAMQNRGTYYEAAVIRADGTQARLGYLGRHSAIGLFTAVRGRPCRVLAFLGLDPNGSIECDFDKKTKSVKFDDGAVIKFTGRTERDAVMAGELDALPVLEN
jgi:hypothetical protein